jgi:hypothetical protein
MSSLNIKSSATLYKYLKYAGTNVMAQAAATKYKFYQLAARVLMEIRCCPAIRQIVRKRFIHFLT